MRIGDACQDSGEDSLRDEDDRDGSHRDLLLDQSHRCLHIDARFDDLKWKY